MFLIKKGEKAVVDIGFVVEMFSAPCVVWSPGEETDQGLWTILWSEIPV